MKLLIKSLVLLLFLVLAAMPNFAQSNFEKGYFLKENGDRVDCFIKNLNWKNNPTSFEYRISETSPTFIGQIVDIQEFGVAQIKYKRFEVQIDRSTDDLDNLDDQKTPAFNLETLFLQTLVEGNADLYIYRDFTLTRFFYTLSDGAVQQLVYKRFLKEATKLGVNDTYRLQLLESLTCEALSIVDVQETKYAEKDLIRYFIKYNSCIDPGYHYQSLSRQRKSVNLFLRSGARFSSFYSENDTFNGLVISDFGRKIGFQIGLGLELTLPFNNNRWTLNLEPTFQSSNSDFAPYSTDMVTLRYRSIELLATIRYYFPLGAHSRLFLGAGYVLDLPFDSKIDFEVRSADIEVKEHNNAIFEIGYNYRNKVDLAFRYQANRNLLHNRIFWETEFNSVAIIFGYNILSN